LFVLVIAVAAGLPGARSRSPQTARRFSGAV